MNTIISVRNKLAKFLVCELDCNSGQLSVSGAQQKLEPMVHQFLLLLIQHQGSIVSKQQVLDALWPNKTPTDETLRALVKKAREALKDNARNPSYIKTIPTKGYLLIPVVELSSTVIQSWVLQHAKLIMWATLVVLVSISLVAWYLYSLHYTDEYKNKVTVIKSNVGIVNRNKVSTNYINGSLKNIWMLESDINNSSQLQIFDITTKFQQTIAFPNALSKQFWYSRASQSLLLMRIDGNGFYSIKFGKQDSQADIVEYDVKLPLETTINALDYDGKHVFVTLLKDKALGLFSLVTAELVNKPATVSVLQETEAAGKELFNDKTQSVFINVWPSPSSNGFVVSLDFRYKTRMLYYSSVDAGKPESAIDIVGGIQSGVWNKDGQRFSFTDSRSRLLAYQIDEGKLTSFNVNGEPVNRVVADCGSSCFVVANTQGIPKLSEFTNPFIVLDNKGKINQALNSAAQIIETNSIARNEYLPQYTAEGLYFVSQQADKTEIIFRQSNNLESVVYRFDKQSTVDELTVDSSGNYLAGMVNQRPFLLEVSAQKLSFLPLTFPHVSHITFAENNKIRFYAEATAFTRPNRNLLPSMLAVEAPNNVGQSSGLYEFTIDSRKINFLVENVKLQRSVELIDITDKGSSRYKAVLTLKDNAEMVVSFQNNRQTTVIDISAGDCANCWHVRGNYLYQIRPSNNKESSSMMTRVNLLTGDLAKQTLLFTDLLNTFSIHPNSNKMMVTTRQNLQTELTKIEGLLQVY